MAERSILGIPNALNWLYAEALNHATDLVFWQETKYKPNQPLNPADPADSAMIPKWWATRARMVRTLSPRDLIRVEAVERATNAYQPSAPHILFTAGSSGFNATAFPDGTQLESYLTQHLPGVSYFAIFNANDPKWPQPTYETYPRADRTAPNVSGEPSQSPWYKSWGTWAKIGLGAAVLGGVYYMGSGMKKNLQKLQRESAAYEAAQERRQRELRRGGLP